MCETSGCEMGVFFCAWAYNAPIISKAMMEDLDCICLIINGLI
jgi:hypothetical protein